MSSSPLNGPVPLSHRLFAVSPGTYGWAAVVLVTVIGAFRLWYTTYLDVLPDEAYYWLWSKHLDASYYSKGPAIAWTIAAGTAVFGDNAFGIRWLSVLLAAGTGWQLFIFARRLFDAEVAFFVLAVAAVVPIFAVGSVLMTIDPLSVFFWIWAMNLFLDAITDSRWWRWALVGFAIGCGFLAKQVNALQLVSLILFLIWCPSYRKLWKDPRLLWVLITFLLMATPMVWWNIQHDWITVTHVASHAQTTGGSRFNPGEFVQFLFMQAVVISPLVFLLILWAMGAALGRKDKTAAERVALSLWLPVFGLYIVLSFNDSGEANWPITSYLGALPLAVWTWRNWAVQLRWARWLVGAALVIGLLETIVLHETRPLGLPAESDPLNRARGWDSFGEHVDALRREHDPDFLVGSKYQTVALMSYYLPDRPTAYMAPGGVNQFSFWPSFEPFVGLKVLYITEREGDFHDNAFLSMLLGFDYLGTFTTKHTDGLPLKTYHAYLCTLSGKGPGGKAIPEQGN